MESFCFLVGKFALSLQIIKRNEEGISSFEKNKSARGPHSKKRGKHVASQPLVQWSLSDRKRATSPTCSLPSIRTLKISLYSSNRYFLFSAYFFFFYRSFCLHPAERNIVLFRRWERSRLIPSAWKRFCIEIWKLWKLTGGGWWIVSQVNCLVDWTRRVVRVDQFLYLLTIILAWSEIFKVY